MYSYNRLKHMTFRFLLALALGTVGALVPTVSTASHPGYFGPVKTLPNLPLGRQRQVAVPVRKVWPSPYTL